MIDGKIKVSILHLESLNKVDVYLCRTVRQFLNTALTDIAKTYKNSDADNLYTISYNQEATSRNLIDSEAQVILMTEFWFNDTFKQNWCLMLSKNI